MGRGTSSSSKRGREESEEANERNRLRKLGLEKHILSDSPAKCSAPLKPSKQVVKHHGKDIIRKSQRKNRFLFSFPGLLAPTSGGKIGELDRLSTKNPVLYIDFPQGRMKLFGTIIYPKNKYLTLQFSRGGKNVICEDYFDHMIVFSEAWWIGTKEENPEETRLEFPKELTQGQQTEFDFKGGAGGVPVPVNTQGNRNQLVEKEPLSPEAEFDINLSDDDEESQENKIQVTPIRQSGRTAGKKFNYAETSPEDVSDNNDSNTSKEGAKTVVEEEAKTVVVKTDSSAETVKLDHPSATEGSKKKTPRTSSAVKKEKSNSGDGLLVQATLSTLFKKAEEKANGSSKKTPSSRGRKS